MFQPSQILNQVGKSDYVKQLTGIEATNFLVFCVLKPVKDFAKILKIIFCWKSKAYTEKHKYK